VAKKRETVWRDVPLAEVLAYFAEGFEPQDGSKVIEHEAFVDTAKGRVVFKLRTELELPKHEQGDGPK
jgi:hypothetical protein